MSEQAEMMRRGKKATMSRRTRLLGLALALAAGSAVLIPGHAAALPAGFPKIGMVCTPGSVSGTTHTFNLVANTGYEDTPDGNSIFMWSYANHDAPDNDHFQTPGPVLCVNEGENVVVNLTNTLPEPVSIVFPGQEGVTASGGSAGPSATALPQASRGRTCTRAARTRRSRSRWRSTGRSWSARTRPPALRSPGPTARTARAPGTSLTANTCSCWPRSTPSCITRSRPATARTT